MLRLACGDPNRGCTAHSFGRSRDGGGPHTGRGDEAIHVDDSNIRIAAAPDDCPVVQHTASRICHNRAKAQRIANTSEQQLIFYAVCAPPFTPDAYSNLEQSG